MLILVFYDYVIVTWDSYLDDSVSGSYTFYFVVGMAVAGGGGVVVGVGRGVLLGGYGSRVC